MAAQRVGVAHRDASSGGGETRDADADLALLRRNLCAGGAQSGPDHPDWLRAVAAGDLADGPGGLRWAEAMDLAQLADGYRLAGEAGLGEPAAFLERKQREARTPATGRVRPWRYGPVSSSHLDASASLAFCRGRR
ncbi:hypothetical protein [Falsiroseomonas sp.]|uniref:hypothetical protein n=1 Tax=Falsiroseomonas sp. TaxID=2870721 RepID=UPI0035660893